MMTKAQFDALFLSGKGAIIAHTITEWKNICKYFQQEYNIRLPCLIEGHDCRTFPYIYFAGNRLDATSSRAGRHIIDFQEWQAILSSDDCNDELCQVSLDEIL